MNNDTMSRREWVVLMLLCAVAGILMVTYCAGCSTPEVIKQNSYNGLKATETADKLLRGYAATDNTGVVAVALEHLAVAAQCWRPVQIWTGVPDNPQPYDVKNAAETAVAARESAEMRNRLEALAKKVATGNPSAINLTELLLGLGALAAAYAAKKGVERKLNGGTKKRT